MSIINISPSEEALFDSLCNKIISYDHNGFYEELLYQGGAHLVNKYTDDLKSLLLYAIIANNQIAFDILFTFGFRWNEETANIIQQQLANMTSPISPAIYDRIVDLQLSCYLINNDLKFTKPNTELATIDDRCNYGNMQIDVAPLKGKKYQFKSALNALTKLPEIEELLSQAFDGKPFQVALVDSEHLYSGGDCNYVTKTIRIDSSRSIYSIITIMLFELCNSVNRPLSQVVITDYSTADEFALAVEKLEYCSDQHYQRLLPILAAANGFIATFGHDSYYVESRIQQEIDYGFRTFDDYWKIQNEIGSKEFSHSEIYRILFRQYQQLISYQPPLDVQPKPVETEKLAATEIIPEAKEDTKPAVLPGFTLIIEQAPALAIEGFFSSAAAKAFFDIIKKNQAALDIITRYDMPQIQRLATKINERMLNIFRRMNGRTQVEYLKRFPLSELQKITRHPPVKVG